MKKLKISELQLKPLLGLVICICISVFVLWNTKNHRLGYVWEEHSHSKSSVEKRQDIIDTCFL
ncbi:hypothetical protein LJC53_05790, partial [Bacteroidales bacterium OttesenSCG-928-C03]|nr:hypothetical protein [Bacteroidales bacterium OttesenSCG-928-C03]